jgi:putative NIF3 family GTP cyclohydrolase 1 type 2
MKAREIEAIINSILKPEYGIPSEKDNGILIGDPERDVDHLAVCWSPTEKVLLEAVAIGAEAVLSHEIPYIPVGETSSELWSVPEPDCIPANIKRRKICQDNQLILLKYHYPLDGWPLWGTPRALASALGFDPGRAEWINRFVPAFSFEPQTLGSFAEQVRIALGMSGIDVAGRLDKPIRKVILIVGGFATRFWISEFARQSGSDVMITGEMLDYTARAALEADVAVIKASHYATENPAVIRLAEYLKATFADHLKVTYLASGDSWNHFGGSLK